MINATKLLSDYAYKLKFADVPQSDLDYTRRLILDYYAAAFAGYRINAGFNNAMEAVLFSMSGAEEASVLFSDKKLPAMNAAMLNACYAHGADMDDGHKRAMGHVGAHVISAVFALAECRDVTEQEVLEAIIVGYEVYVRISSAVQPSLAKRGFHSTGTAGAVACAAACAKLIKLDANGIYNSMAISVTQGSGLLIVAESGQTVKPINPAKAAQSGILSALLAERGVVGAQNPLESEKGWFHAMADDVDENAITDNLGVKNEISGCYFKPYPSCRHTHCGIEAALKLRARNEGKKLEKAELYIYENAIKIAGQIKRPNTDDDTKFSIHYSLAVALQTGAFTLDNLNADTVDNEVWDMVERITLINDPTMEDKEKGIRGARLKLYYADRSVDEETVTVPKGDPEVPFTTEDIRAKLKACCGSLLCEQAQSKLFDTVMSFGTKKRFAYSVF